MLPGLCTSNQGIQRTAGACDHFYTSSPYALSARLSISDPLADDLRAIYAPTRPPSVLDLLGRQHITYLLRASTAATRTCSRPRYLRRQRYYRRLPPCHHLTRPRLRPPRTGPATPQKKLSAPALLGAWAGRTEPKGREGRERESAGVWYERMQAAAIAHASMQSKADVSMQASC